MAKRTNKSLIDMPYSSLVTLRGTQLMLMLTWQLANDSRIFHLLLIAIVKWKQDRNFYNYSVYKEIEK